MNENDKTLNKRFSIKNDTNLRNSYSSTKEKDSPRKSIMNYSIDYLDKENSIILKDFGTNEKINYINIQNEDKRKSIDSNLIIKNSNRKSLLLSADKNNANDNNSQSPALNRRESIEKRSSIRKSITISGEKNILKEINFQSPEVNRQESLEQRSSIDRNSNKRNSTIRKSLSISEELKNDKETHLQSLGLNRRDSIGRRSSIDHNLNKRNSINPNFNNSIRKSLSISGEKDNLNETNLPSPKIIKKDSQSIFFFNKI